MHGFKVEKGMATGFDEKGAELVSVPTTESVFVRSAYDAKVGAIRNNTP